jgi:hypothetical protein
MSAITEARVDVVDLLTGAGFTAFDHIPSRIVPPSAVVSAGAPYVVPGPTYSLLTLNLVVTLIAGQASNPVATAELDTAIEDALNVLEDATEVGQPYMLTANNAQYLAVDLSITTNIEIGGN